MNSIVILKSIKEILRQVDENIDVSKITMETNIVDDLGFDSVRIIYLLLLTEVRFNISFKKVTCNDFKTIKDIIDYICLSRKA